MSAQDVLSTVSVRTRRFGKTSVTGASAASRQSNQAWLILVWNPSTIAKSSELAPWAVRWSVRPCSISSTESVASLRLNIVRCKSDWFYLSLKSGNCWCSQLSVVRYRCIGSRHYITIESRFWNHHVEHGGSAYLQVTIVGMHFPAGCFAACLLS